MQIRALYKKMGANPFTPEVINYDFINQNNTVVELSRGEDVDGDPVYGVSVFNIDHELNQLDADTDKGNAFFGEDAKIDARKLYNKLIK